MPAVRSLDPLHNRSFTFSGRIMFPVDQLTRTVCLRLHIPKNAHIGVPRMTPSIAEPHPSAAGIPILPNTTKFFFSFRTPYPSSFVLPLLDWMENQKGGLKRHTKHAACPRRDSVRRLAPQIPFFPLFLSSSPPLSNFSLAVTRTLSATINSTFFGHYKLVPIMSQYLGSSQT